ncbi:MAG: hypothetical protein V3W06_06600 [Acidimicrobiia bacterium]
MAKRRVSRAFMFVAAASLLLWLAPGALADECSATVDGSLAREEPDGDITRLVFRVEIATMSDCAEIKYDVILEIQNEDQKVEKKKLGRYVKLHDGSIAEKVNHELGSGESLVSWEVKLDSCTKCN